MRAEPPASNPPCSLSALIVIERNFKILNGGRSRPTLVCEKNGPPVLVVAIKRARIRRTGESRSRPATDTAMSRHLFIRWSPAWIAGFQRTRRFSEQESGHSDSVDFGSPRLFDVVSRASGAEIPVLPDGCGRADRVHGSWTDRSRTRAGIRTGARGLDRGDEPPGEVTVVVVASDM